MLSFHCLDSEMISMAIVSFELIQEGHLSVCCERNAHSFLIIISSYPFYSPLSSTEGWTCLTSLLLR